MRVLFSVNLWSYRALLIALAHFQFQRIFAAIVIFSIDIDETDLLGLLKSNRNLCVWSISSSDYFSYVGSDIDPWLLGNGFHFFWFFREVMSFLKFSRKFQAGREEKKKKKLLKASKWLQFLVFLMESATIVVHNDYKQWKQKTTNNGKKLK